MTDKSAITEGLKITESKIKNNEYVSELKGIQNFSGADVIISKKLTPENKRWIENQSSGTSSQKTNPEKRLVITPYSTELSWLFYQLKDLFKDSVDYMSKYDFYGSLAQAAIDFIENSGEDYDCNSLLIAVLDEAKKME